MFFVRLRKLFLLNLVLIGVFFGQVVYAADSDGSIVKKVGDSIKNTTEETRYRLERMSEKKTATSEKADQMAKVDANPYGIGLYHPNYILPGYYNSFPVAAMDATPGQQRLRNIEFKYQISLKTPLWSNIGNPNHQLDAAFTQDAFWQLYITSPYFRETDYMPELILQNRYNNMFNWNAAIVHQSNGRGGLYERSWNRAYLEGVVSGENWALSTKVWQLMFTRQSSDLHNRDITHYMGHGRFLFTYRYGNQALSLMLRNNLESRFRRGAVQVTYSVPLPTNQSSVLRHYRLYLLYFNGYGQSLIEYNAHAESYGIGLAYNDWIV